MTRPGQTLLELLIAFAIVTTGVVGVMTLLFSNVSLAQRDADEVVAINLAREGVEFAKQVRDSHWLARRPFDDGLKGDARDITATPVWNIEDKDSLPVFNFTANSFDDPNALVIKTKQEVFANQFREARVSGETTGFKRLLSFFSLCANSSVVPMSVSVVESGACPPSAERKVGVRVKSHVQWSRKGVQKNTVILEELYDWK